MAGAPVEGVERLVVVGCSWGGLAATSAVLDHLPHDLPVSVVVVQHRSPEPSPLRALLARHTRWPVREAEDKEPIAPATVHVAPGGYHLLVDGARFALSTEAPVRHSRPSVDVLLESAADAFTDRLVAVVLTGANADGAAGLRRVVRRGGVGIVQDPATAERREMPDAALATGVPVHVAPPEEIGAIVAGIVRGGPAPVPVDGSPRGAVAGDR